MTWCIDILVLILYTIATYQTGLSARIGKFRIADNGVKGEGTYSLNNSTAEINLHLLIGNTSSTPGGQQQIKVPPLIPTQNTKPQGGQIDQANKPQMGPTQETSSTKNGNKGMNTLQESLQKMLPEETQLSDEDMAFAYDGLSGHNKFRKLHNAKPLQLDKKMCAEAQRFARQLAKLGTLKHSARDSRQGQGENLAMGCSSGDLAMSAEAATKKWYDEVCKYDFGNKSFQKPCGHFSQVVWKSSDRLGVGQAKGTKWGMNCTFIVARYAPLGNVANLTSDNVDKGSFDQSYCNTVTRTNPEKNTPPQEETLNEEYRYYPNYGLNEGFLNDEGEGSRSIGFRGKIPRISMKVEIL